MADGFGAIKFDIDHAADELRHDPEMARLSEELESVIQREIAKVLQLVCFENPTPDAWRPLPETCEGVIDRPGLLEFRG